MLFTTGGNVKHAKETWKNTYQMSLVVKETEEDHPTEEEPLRTRRKETR
jgi:hypothetical protein